MRHQFWREAVFAKVGAVIPARLRKTESTSKFSMSSIVGELLREPAHCPHIEHPQPPEHVWGIPPSELRSREKALYEAADGVSETYTRRGVEHSRRQKSTTPILLIAVASWPEPTMARTPERDRWSQLVIEHSKGIWGPAFRGAYAHTDEAFYHLHLLADADGGPVKQLHAGYAAVMKALELEPSLSRKGQAEAYRRGCVEAQDDYHESVGAPMGWARLSASPKPRAPRTVAIRERQAEIEAAEVRLIVAGKKLLTHKEELEALRVQLAARDAHAAKREALISEQVETLRRMRLEIQDQHAIEDVSRKLLDTGYWKRLGA